VSLAQIAILIGLAALTGRLQRGRQHALLAVSTAAVFWLQPAAPVATLGYWLPFGTMAITIVAWEFTAEPGSRSWRRNWSSAAIMIGIIAAIQIDGASRRLFSAAVISPPVGYVLLGSLAVLGLLAIGLRVHAGRAVLSAGLAAVIVVAFIVLKTPGLANAIVTWLRSHVAGGDPSPIQGAISWLGFSYVAFRLLHTIRDSQAGRLPELALGEYVNYVIFFPSFTAGPIDRAERFVKDLRQPLGLANEDWLDAGTRLILGLFKKFVVADLLAVISINDVVVPRIHAAGWMWLFLYAYAFRIYFDFSGYTDMAIGMGRLMGIRLPENFDSPYLKQNIALFWNAWHMSLTQWFRSYVFNPLTRSLRSSPRPLPTWTAILITQVVTMVLIGLWHGITMSFALWGLWHGLGLFAHNRWSSWRRAAVPDSWQAVGGARLAGALGTFMTFNFVAVGWLLFGLSSPALAWAALRVMVGAG
jgi:alginate O-acetyltransferase complex protein AlgI